MLKQGDVIVAKHNSKLQYQVKDVIRNENGTVDIRLKSLGRIPQTFVVSSTALSNNYAFGIYRGAISIRG